MNDGSLPSARRIVPLLLELLPVSSVVDVGCGEGAWLSVFRDAGVEDIAGFDGQSVELSRLRIPESAFIRHDLRQPLPVPRNFDLALSLEVAEHLPAERAASFVKDLTRLAPVVAFSAAIPGQGGNGHVNEQFQDYWQALFAREEYVACDCIRAQVWDVPDVCFWYAQNLVIYCAADAVSRTRMSAGTLRQPMRMVHPRLYERFATPPSVRQSASLLQRALQTSVHRRLRRVIGSTVQKSHR